MTDPILTAYELWQGHGLTLVPAPRRRDWMDKTPHRNANHCLPMLMANQAGWLVCNNERVVIRWRGGIEPEAVEILYRDPDVAAAMAVDMAAARAGGGGAVQGRPSFPHSRFGHGIVTWAIPFLFRTPPGYNLLVRGPANCAKHGITPLEGLVETDWLTLNFTVSWRFTRAGSSATFAKGEPLCMIVPQRRGDLEEFLPEVLPIDADPELAQAHRMWSQNRKDAAVAATAWQHDYMRGTSPNGSAAPQHQTRLHLKEFTARGGGDWASS
jgi:hypothetical protein